MGLFENNNWLVTRLQWLEKKTWKHRRLRIATIFALVAIMAACVLPMAKGAGSADVNILPGKELSQVFGISLIKNTEKGVTRSSSSSSSNHSHSRQSFKSEKLAVILKRISKDYPVKFKAKLPKGYYDLNAHVDGSERMLLEGVGAVFSRSFDLDVSIRPYKQKAIILSCPDPAKIKLKRSDRDISCGFYKQEKNEDDTYTEKFITDIDQLTKFARRHVLAKNDYKLTLVNETNLEGLFEGSLRWSMEDEKVLIQSLKDMGFKVTKATREVGTVVVDNNDPNKDYTNRRPCSPIKPELVLRSHKYQTVDEEIYFTLDRKYDVHVQLEKMPKVKLVIDGKEYSTNRSVNPHSSGSFRFGYRDSVREKNRPELKPGRYTIYALLEDYDYIYKNEKKHMKGLRSNEIEFEVVDELPGNYFKGLAIENGNEVLDNCHIKMLYLTTDTSDNTKEYTEIITLKGYTPPFNLAVKAYLESESGKKVFIQDLAVVSTVGEIVPNNTFSHKDFNVGESLLSSDDLIKEKWRVVLEPSRQVAQTNPLIKSYYGQKYFGPYQNIQMGLNSFRFDDAGFTHKSSAPLSNFHSRHTKTIDMDANSTIGEVENAELKFDKEKNVFRVISDNGVSAVKLNRTHSLISLKDQMAQAVNQLFGGKGDVGFIEIRSGELDMYAVRSSKGHYFLLTVNGIEHNHNGIGFGNSGCIEYSRFQTDKNGLSGESKQAEVRTTNIYTATLPDGVTLELVGTCRYTDEGAACYRPDGTPLGRQLRIAKWNQTPKAGDVGVMLKLDGPDGTSLSYHGIEGSKGWEGSCHVVDENGQELNGYEAALTRFNPDQKTTTCRFGIAFGPWTTVARHDGKQIGIDNDISFTKANQTDKGVQIFTTDTLGRNINQRIVAIDTSGKLHPWKGYTGSVRKENLRQSIGTFPDLKLDQIKEFEFQTRPY
ncbi:MAG: hypothetical protein ACYTE0_09815, partial [Planctomycetota bacterium]